MRSPKRGAAGWSLAATRPQDRVHLVVPGR
jgi:hypothetical protein